MTKPIQIVLQDLVNNPILFLHSKSQEIQNEGNPLAMKPIINSLESCMRTNTSTIESLDPD